MTMQRRSFEKRNRDRKNRRGVAMVEFAVVMPVTIVLLTAVVELSVLVNTTTLLQSAVREGGRMGAMTTAD
jgi:Flp pilus assembly protein TadG